MGSVIRAKVPEPAANEQGASQKKSDKTRERILQSAARVFAAKGYYHTRLTDIATEAGTHSGALYYYFSSRDELVQALLSNSVRRLQDAVEEKLEQLPAAVSPLGRIEAAVVAHVDYILGDDVFVRAYMRIQNQIEPSLRRRYVEFPRAYARLWKDLFGKAKEAGLLADNIDLNVARQVLLGAMVWTLDWYNPGKLTPATIGKRIYDVLCNGIQNRASSQT